MDCRTARVKATSSRNPGSCLAWLVHWASCVRGPSLWSCLQTLLTEVWPAGGGGAGGCRSQDQLWIRWLFSSASAKKQSASPEAARCVVAASDRGLTSGVGSVLVQCTFCFHCLRAFTHPHGLSSEEASDLGTALPLG